MMTVWNIVNVLFLFIETTPSGAAPAQDSDALSVCVLGRGEDTGGPDSVVLGVGVSQLAPALAC